MTFGKPCCARDGGWPPEAAVQAEASNHPLLLCSRGMVVSELGKGRARPCQVWIAEFTGGGFKPPTAAVLKRHGGERVPGKRQGETLSGRWIAELNASEPLMTCSARDSCRHAASKRPDFQSARKVRMGCPVPYSDQRIPAPFMRLLIRTLFAASTGAPHGPGVSRTSAYFMRCRWLRKKASSRRMTFVIPDLVDESGGHLFRRCPGGIRHEGGKNAICETSARLLYGTWEPVAPMHPEGRTASGGPASGRVPMRGTGADHLVVVRKVL